MSVKSITNILIGSTMQLLDKKLIIGEVNSNSVALLLVLKKSFEYALAMYNNGNPSYVKAIKILNRKIQDLKYQCSDICDYKDRFVFQGSTPTIENNAIVKDLNSTFKPLSISDIIHNYKDEDNSPPDKIRIVDKTSSIIIHVNGEELVLNKDYSVNDIFTIKLDDSSLTYVNKTEQGVCSTIAVDTSLFNQYKDEDQRVLEMGSNYLLMQFLLQTEDSVIDSHAFTGFVVEEDITGIFKVQVKSTSNKKEWSNEASIDVNFTTICEDVGVCSEFNSRTLQNTLSYSFTPEDFGLTGMKDKIKYMQGNYTDGVLEWKGHLLISGQTFPLIITKEDLEAEKLVWFSSSIDENHTCDISYKTANRDSYNYCIGGSLVVFTKKSV